MTTDRYICVQNKYEKTVAKIKTPAYFALPFKKSKPSEFILSD